MYKTMKIYYDNVTGERIWDNSYNGVKVIDFDHDYATVIDLNSRVKESIGLLVLTDGQYEQDFLECILVGVDVVTKIPIFAEHPEEGQPPVILNKPFSVQIEELGTRAVGMQEIDAFTLDKSFTLEERAEGMQGVDDFTLSLVSQMQTKMDELEAKILILEGT